jgi:3-hydroxybutyryl-CoA dehydrogenase
MGVVGGGTMGAGIAQTAAQAGFAVRTFDARPEVVRAAYDAIAQRLDRQVTQGKRSRLERDKIVQRLHVADDTAAFKDAEVVIEAVPEDLALKKKVLGELDGLLPPTALLATNTSSLSIAELAESLRQPERFLGMHFFNPAPVMQLVELVSGPQTTEPTTIRGVSVVRSLDKTPIQVKDSPGFVVNRIARPFYLEALALLESGRADVRTIDAAVKSVGGLRMGPFELLDLIGLDVNLAVTQTVYEGFDRDARYAPSAIQVRLVEQGRHGRKTGCGFYDYTSNPAAVAFETPQRAAEASRPGPALRAMAETLGHTVDRAYWLYARIMLAIVNEAACVAESIARPNDVDIGARLGLNFPVGPLELADHVGLDVVLDAMREMHADDPAGRYTPAPLLIHCVDQGRLGEKTAYGFLRHSL